MRKIPFYKMSGSGNDFIIIDNRDGKMDGINIVDFVVKTCARCVSVGADGLFLIEAPKKGADFSWQFYNSDGSVAEMCGNGSRCAARFAYLNGIAGEKMSFETLAGVIEAEIKAEPDVKVRMTQPFDYKESYTLDVEGEKIEVNSVNTGVPHCVVFTDDVESADLVKFGPALRYHEYYAPKGTNVNFCGVDNNGHLRVRTYERGVEGETMACGTGSVACAMFAVSKGLLKSPVTIKTTSGKLLKVYLEGDKVYLEGEARVIYTGELTDEAVNY